MLFIIRVFLFSFVMSCSWLSAIHVKEGHFIEDDELEYIFKDYISRIYKVAGLDPKGIRIFFIHDLNINAAASLGHTYFVNTGLILEAEDVGEVLGVLAHEVSHEASQHVERRLSAMHKAGRTALAVAALGILGGVASGNPELAMMGVMGAMGSAMRVGSHYSQGQEGAADQGAIKYAHKLQWSLKGLHRLLTRLKGNDYLVDQDLAPYVMTHPLTKDRLDTLEAHIKESPYSDKPFDADLVASFQRIKTKVEAYTLLPEQFLNIYHANDTRPVVRYGRAIALLRQHNYLAAHKVIDTLIEEFPDDPYFMEIKGAIFMEEGKIASAIATFEKVLRLRPQSYVLKAQLAQICISTNKAADTQRAKGLLDSLEFTERDSPRYWTLRATVYGRLGQEAHAQWMLAEAEALRGDKERALLHVKRAHARLKTSKNTESTKRLEQRIQDLLSYLEIEQQRQAG